MRQIREIMTESVTTLSPEDTVLDAAKKMAEKKIGSVIVMHKNKLAGIFTERDISSKITAMNLDPGKTLLKDVMHSDVTTAQPDLSITEAADIMSKGRFRRLPIVDKNGILGIVTQTDVEKALTNEIAEEAKKSREFLNTVIDALDDALYVRDDQKRYSVLSKKAKNLIRLRDARKKNTSANEPSRASESDKSTPSSEAGQQDAGMRINREDRIKVKGEERIILTKETAFIDPITGRQYIAGLISDITQRKSAEDELRKRLEREEIVEKVSSNFVHLPDFDEAIEKSLKDMGKGMDISLAYFYKLMKNRSIIRRSHEWIPEGLKKDDLEPDVKLSDCKWWINQLTKNKLISCSSVAKIPNQKVKISMISRKARSLLSVPVFIGEELYGFLGFEEWRKNRTWHKENVALITTISEIISMGVQRKKVENELKDRITELEKFNKLAIGRELKMIELKKKVKELEKEVD